MSSAIDHVLLAVEDLEEGARRLLRDQGLVALPGGRHPGAGTANMILPLGAGYLELIAVVDAAEAAANALSRRVTAALERGSALAAWAARAGDLDRVKTRLDAAGVAAIGPRAGSRLRPDGVLLEWRTLHAGDGLNPAVPFLIEWSVPPGEHPGQVTVTHPAGRVELRGLRLRSADPDRLRDELELMLGELPSLTIEEGDRDELAAVELEVDGEVRLLSAV